MTTRLSFVTQPYHKNDSDRVFFDAFKPRSIEFVVPGEEPVAPDLSHVPQDTLIVLRHYRMSENWGTRLLVNRAQAEQQGKEHAEFGKKLADDAIGRFHLDASRLLIAGLNEPNLWGGEPPQLFTYYEVARMRRLHSFGLRAQFCKFSVGWPANTGTDTPPDWSPFLPILQEYKPGDYLCLHEYWDVQGPQDMWGWWAGRFTKCPWNVPIIIGECGIDRFVRDASVPGHLRGWQNNIDADLYMKQLAYYDDRLHEDRRIFSAQIFTYDFANPWGVFDVRNDDMKNRLIARADALRNEQESYIIDIVDSLPKGPGQNPMRPLSAIDKIVVHHTATPIDTTPEAIAKHHTQTNLWPSIAYHYLIYSTGKTFLTNRLETVSPHALNANESSIGICFVGDFLTITPPPMQIEAGKRLIADLQRQLGPLAIKPHYLYSQTQCPGPWWTVLAPPPPSSVFDEDGVRNAAWNYGFVGVIPYNPLSAYFKKARELNLGAPLSDEHDWGIYRFQKFVGGILAAKTGDWEGMRLIGWYEL